MIFDMLEYCDMLGKSNINIIYSGPIWPDGIESLGETIRKRLKYDDIPFSTSQAVFSVFVEQMNNMLMYSEEKECIDYLAESESGASKGTFVLGVRGKQYFIQCGNVIKNKSVDILKSKIDHLNGLERDELRKYYMEQIKNGNKNPESKGAGLGLIEIARRASSKIEYSFKPLREGYSFYSLYAMIGQGGD